MALPAPAAACAINIPPPQRIQNGLETGTIAGVAIVAIDNAHYTAKPIADAHPWKASAKIVEVRRGAGLPKVIEFERGWGSSACEWNTPPLPAKGSRWVVYFWQDRSGAYRPWLAMTEAEARQFDPGFTAGY